MSVACIICGTTGEMVFEAPADPWCDTCYDLECERQNAEDRKGSRSFGGMKVPTFTRPPMYMLPQDRWPEHGYTLDTIRGFKERQAEREAKKEADKKAKADQKEADYQRRIEELRNSKWVTG